MLKRMETGFSDLLTKKNVRVVTKSENYLINADAKKLPTAAKAVSKATKDITYACVPLLRKSN